MFCISCRHVTVNPGGTLLYLLETPLELRAYVDRISATEPQQCSLKSGGETYGSSSVRYGSVPYDVQPDP